MEQYHPRPDLTVTDLGDELVLLDPRDQSMFALDHVGRFIWTTLSGHPLGEVAERVVEHYGVERAVAERDLRALVSELRDAGLVLRDTAPRPE